MPISIDYANIMSFLGEQVRVHMNLHRKMFSISVKHEGKGWRVVGYATDVYLTDVTFKVSEAGNRRVKESGTRNVHAYAYGKLAHVFQELTADAGPSRRVFYNPRENTTFVDQMGRTVNTADHAMFSIAHGVSIWNEGE